MSDENLKKAYAQIVELVAVVNNFDGDDAQQAKASARLREIEKQVLATPADSVEGIRIKLEIWCQLMSDETNEPPLDQRTGWVNLPDKFGVSAILDARRLASLK